MAESSLYERLGGVFAIAAVVDRFSDALIDNPIVGQGVGAIPPCVIGTATTWRGFLA